MRKFKTFFRATRYTHTHTHTHTQPFNGRWTGTTRVGWYQKKHSPTHTQTDHRTSFIIFLHLQRSMASSLFILHAWQSSRTTSLLLVLDPELHTPYISSPNHHNLFAAHAHTNVACSAAKPMLCHLYIPSFSLGSLLGSLSFSLTPHIHLTILISARWSATKFSFLTGQASLPCNMLLCKQLL